MLPDKQSAEATLRADLAERKQELARAKRALLWQVWDFAALCFTLQLIVGSLYVHLYADHQHEMELLAWALFLNFTRHSRRTTSPSRRK